MNILFVMLSFPRLTEASMYTSLVMEFKQHGHSVYPVAPALINQTKTGIYKENGVDVLRVKTLNLFDPNLFKKGLANILLPSLFKKAIIKHWKNICVDLIIVPTPTVMFADLVVSLSRFFDARIYLMLKDIFPQNAVDLGMMKKGGMLYNFFRSREKILYNAASWIGCTSQANIDYMVYNNKIPLSKLHVLNNCSKEIQVNSSVSFNMIRDKYGIYGNFIVVFGGNMGVPQQIENIISLADKCRVFDDVAFLLIGKGTKTDYFKRVIAKDKKSNVKIISYIPNEEYRVLLSSCDLGLISLNEKFTVPNTPYKLNDYLGVKIPVLASIDHCTDLGKILVDNNAGLYAYADNPEDLFDKFKILYNNVELRRIMGQNGYRFFKENLTTIIAYKTIISHVS